MPDSVYLRRTVRRGQEYLHAGDVVSALRAQALEYIEHDKNRQAAHTAAIALRAFADAVEAGGR